MNPTPGKQRAGRRMSGPRRPLSFQLCCLRLGCTLRTCTRMNAGSRAATTSMLAGSMTTGVGTDDSRAATPSSGLPEPIFAGATTDTPIVSAVKAMAAIVRAARGVEVW